MNIAIIIGVSIYLNPDDNLPGSKNDADAIYQIITKTKKFDRILLINENQNSAEVKMLITNLISDVQSTTVNEVFFYYSGHGEFTQGEFYYILSDYDSKKRNQTSLQNTEIDNLIKTLSPQIVVKVIDACQSGAFYIKESGALNKYFSDTTNTFKKCYFLNSSLNSQSSFANAEISFFTLSFIKAIKEYKSEEIRYKDIIDVIADDFSGNTEQTPLFVIQADFTEKFCAINSDLKSYLLSEDKLLIDDKSENSVQSLFEIIKEDAKNYVSKEDAMKALTSIQSNLENLKLNNTLKALYEVKVEFLNDYKDVAKLLVVQKWLDDNTHNYFVTSIFEDTYDDLIGPYREVVGFDLNIEAPFKVISINFISKFPNVQSYQSKILYFLSKKSIRFFYFTTNFVETGWDNKYLNLKSLKWFTSDYSVCTNDELLKGVNNMLNKIQEKIEKELQEKFNKTEEDGTDGFPF